MRCQTGRGDVHRGLSLFEADTGLEPGDGIAEVRGSREPSGIAEPVEGQPNVNALAARKFVAAADVFEIRGHHTDDLERRVGEPDGLADYLRVSAEQPLPYAVADDGGISGPSAGFFFRSEGAAQERLETEHAKEAIRDAHRGEAFGAVAAILLVLADVGRDVLEDTILAAIVEEIGR